MDRYFPDEYYDEKGIYIPRLYGRPYIEWYQLFGLKNKEEIKAYVEEQRIDIIGQNGNEGLHYEWREKNGKV
jgi:hypothetical protein